MAAYSLGLGLPFLFTALMLDSAQGGLRRLTRHMNTIKVGSGVLLVLVGFSIGSGQLQQLSLTFSRDFGDFSYRVEQCTVGVVEGDITGGQLWDCYNDNPGPYILTGINEGTIDPVTFERIDDQDEPAEEARGAVDTPVTDVETNIDIAPVTNVDEVPADALSIADDALSVAAPPSSGK